MTAREQLFTILVVREKTRAKERLCQEMLLSAKWPKCFFTSDFSLWNGRPEVVSVYGWWIICKSHENRKIDHR